MFKEEIFGGGGGGFIWWEQMHSLDNNNNNRQTPQNKAYHASIDFAVWLCRYGVFLVCTDTLLRAQFPEEQEQENNIHTQAFAGISKFCCHGNVTNHSHAVESPNGHSPKRTHLPKEWVSCYIENWPREEFSYLPTYVCCNSYRDH